MRYNPGGYHGVPNQREFRAAATGRPLQWARSDRPAALAAYLNSEYGRPFLSFCPHELPNVGAPLDSFPLSFETVASLPGPIRRSLGRNTENRLGTRSMPPSWPPTRRKA